jgi:hypothetical protein
MDVFCVIKYKVWFCRDYETTEYAKLQLSNDGWDYSLTVIPAKKAKEMIAEYGMIEKIANEYGRVWERPRVSFKRRFRGKYKSEFTEF